MLHSKTKTKTATQLDAQYSRITSELRRRTPNPAVGLSSLANMGGRNGVIANRYARATRCIQELGNLPPEAFRQVKSCVKLLKFKLHLENSVRNRINRTTGASRVRYRAVGGRATNRAGRARDIRAAFRHGNRLIMTPIDHAKRSDCLCPSKTDRAIPYSCGKDSEILLDLMAPALQKRSFACSCISSRASTTLTTICEQSKLVMPMLPYCKSPLA